MPKPTPQQLKRLGPLVLPFERTDFKRKVLYGEDIKETFLSFIYDATDNSYPENVKKVLPNKIIEGDAEDGKYLWIIEEKGLFIIPEQTTNRLAERGVVCHTNLTSGKLAFQGGELWFGTDEFVYINNKSGRYGANTLAQREAILEYFRYVGYQNVKQLI